MAARAALVDAARDLNKVLSLEPPIDVKLGVEALKELIVESSELIREDDKIQDATRAVVDELTGKVPATASDDGDGEVVAAEKPAKVTPAEKPANKVASAEKPAKVTKPKAEKPAKAREARPIGEFKPIRSGTRLHKLLLAASRGETLKSMVQVFADKDGYDEKNVLWSLRYQLGRDHGIGHEIEDGHCRLVLPVGKTLDDCVASTSAP